MSSTRSWTFWVGALVVSLLLAGVVSFYASADPDGLTKVAEDRGFAETETDHELGESPFADYATEGVDDERLSLGVAGVAGTLIALGLGTGLGLALRRRTPAAEHDEPAPAGRT